MTTDGFKATTQTEKPRSKAASDQKGIGIITVGNVAALRCGAFRSDRQDL